MDVRVFESAARAGAHVAEIVVRRLESGSLQVLGVATGASPIPIYSELARLGVAPPDLELVALDEYVGLGSRRSAQLRRPTSILALRCRSAYRRSASTFPPVTRSILRRRHDAFEALIARIGPVDLQILGLGTNGHVGFNEPGSDSDCRRPGSSRLSDRTRRDNAQYFGSCSRGARARDHPGDRDDHASP